MDMGKRLGTIVKHIPSSVFKTLFFLLCAFLVVLILYHILHTLFVYGLGIVSPLGFALIKDLIWFGGGTILVIYFIQLGGYKNIQVFINGLLSGLFLLLGVLLVWSVGYSFIIGAELSEVLIGVKYGILPLLIILSGILFGYIFVGLYRSAFSGLDDGSKSLIGFVRKYTKTILIVLLLILTGGFLWQGFKVIFPELFFQFGYGPVGDYIAGASPPIWYRTGPGGMMRRQGIFSGPNNYGYFLSGVFPLVMFAVWKYRTRLAWIVFGLLIVSLLGTISRGALLAVVIQGVIFGAFLIHKKYKKGLYGLLIAGGITLIGVSFSSLKYGSTITRFEARKESITAFFVNPLGYGLGSSGPAIHFSGQYLPENQFLQILLDIGIVGFLLWLAFFLVLGYLIWKIAKNYTTYLQYFLYAASRGVVGILIIGLFLHSLEDSMVNYLILGPFGLLIGVFYAFSNLPPAGDKKGFDNSLNISDKQNK